MNLTNTWMEFVTSLKDYPNLDFLIVGFVLGFLVSFISILIYQKLLNPSPKQRSDTPLQSDPKSSLNTIKEELNKDSGLEPNK